MGYLFFDNADIVQGSDDVNTSSKTLSPTFKSLCNSETVVSELQED